MRIDQQAQTETQAPNSLIIFTETEFHGEAIRSLLTSWQIFGNVIHVRQPADLHSQLRQTSEPIILLTAKIHGWLTHDFIVQIREWDASSRIIILIQHNLKFSLNSLREVKPDGIINLNDSLVEIFNGFRDVIDGQSYCSKSIDQRTLQLNQKSSKEKDRNGLTPRQREVLCKLAEGHTVKEIAEMMKLSAKSVDSHKYRIMKKLNLSDRVRLARFAIREGMIDP
ncbi:response regulator transcription factor [Rubinisphaera italica]|uniref:Response regulator UvrY n=1 Tax=Rubinisphaera italica TaxID=2527969 RepID=A0A5C5XC95_9PLAN|nr:response regulator transcription factor [Rubinisphaera italica]TWT60384.1 Response regulator UvrY [Rubinisphaera italica]